MGLFRGLREALWNEQNPGKAFEDLAIKFYVQQQEVDLGANSIVAAAEASGVVSPVIPILHPKGTLGWLLLAYQVHATIQTLYIDNFNVRG